jgi:RNA polymerase sigma-70 factor (ECF subfamily)
MEHEELLPLLHKIAKSDRLAFEELYKITSSQIYSVALRMLRKKELAEEATQEAYVRIWYNAGQYTQGKGTVLTWMVSIVRYRALDILRYHKVRKEEPLLDNEQEFFTDDATTEDASDSTVEQGTINKLDMCMNELEISQRQAIQLAFFNGYSHSEVVSHLDTPLGTIKSWIRRGLASLERCLGL